MEILDVKLSINIVNRPGVLFRFGLTVTYLPKICQGYSITPLSIIQWVTLFADLQILSPTSPTRNLDRLYISLVVRLIVFSIICRTQRFSRSPLTSLSSKTFPGPDQTRPDQTCKNIFFYPPSPSKKEACGHPPPKKKMLIPPRKDILEKK